MMRKSILFLSTAIFIFSCNSKQDKQPEAIVDSTQHTGTVITDTSALKDSHYFWSTRVDQKNGLVMERSLPLDEASISMMGMIDTMNIIYPEILVKFVKTSNDTAFVRIPKSNYLTANIGSAGAEGYMAELVYNITEVKGINYVQVNFKPGDHAEPGTYARTDFIDVVRP
jgi:uncharacterized lipoprotein NlpE involved in copper resistance